MIAQRSFDTIDAVPQIDGKGRDHGAQQHDDAYAARQGHAQHRILRRMVNVASALDERWDGFVHRVH
jgi:hypothetical protein